MHWDMQELLVQQLQLSLMDILHVKLYILQIPKA